VLILKCDTISGFAIVRFLKYTIILLSVLLFISPLESSLNYTLLEKDSKLKRLDPILAEHIYIRFAKSTSMIEIYNFLETYNLSITKRLLEYENSFTYLYNARTERQKQDKLMENRILESEDLLLRTYMINILNSSYDIPEVICSKLQSDCGIVEIAEPIYIPSVTGEFVPNDPLLDLQQMHQQMKSYEAWDIYQGDPNVIVGISDTGVLQVHEDLEESIWINENEIPDNDIDDDGNGYVDDYNGYNFAFQLDDTKRGNTYSTNPHGTGTAGLSSATVNNDIGVAGTGFKTKMFPFKTTIDGSNGIYFGYESILYCALNDIDVVNCSWGGHSYSCVNESVIDYCIARDLIIVSGAGNHYSTKPFYPAAYKGVCAVGVTEPQDTIIPMSGRGYYVDIMAPGHKSWTTTNDSAYGSFCCTSGSSPLVAGMLGIIKGLHPELNNRQVVEFAKNCTDDISDINPNYKYYVPGRMNMLKAVTQDPFSLAGIDVESYQFVKKGESQRSRFLIGDTITCSINIHNYLGDANDLTFNLIILDDSDASLKIIEASYSIEQLKNGDDATIKFEVEIEKENINQVLLRLDMNCDECENDYLMIPFYPSSNFINIENNGMELSLSDNGRIGYSDPPYNLQGIGFSYLNSCSYIWESGIICTENRERVISQVRNIDSLPQNDFVIINPYLSPDKDKILLSDNNAPQEKRIGLEISSQYELSQIEEPCVKINLDIKNISGRDLRDFSIAYFFDWDIGVAGDSNRAIINTYDRDIMKPWNSASAIIYHEGDYPSMGTLSFYDKQDYEVVPIAGSMENAITYRSDDRFSDEEKILYLNSGIELQTDFVGDVSVINGMNFPGVFPKGEIRSYSMCLCVEKDTNALTIALLQCAGEIFTGVEDNHDFNLNIYPQPANDELLITFDSRIDSDFTIKIIDMLGREVFMRDYSLTKPSAISIPINISALPSNYYLLNVNSDRLSITKPLIIIK